MAEHRQLRWVSRHLVVYMTASRQRGLRLWPVTDDHLQVLPRFCRRPRSRGEKSAVVFTILCATKI